MILNYALMNHLLCNKKYLQKLPPNTTKPGISVQEIVSKDDRSINRQMQDMDCVNAVAASMKAKGIKIMNAQQQAEFDAATNACWTAKDDGTIHHPEWQ